MEHLEDLEQLLQLDAVDSEEILLERLCDNREVSRLQSRLCVELVDCDRFNY